VTFGTPSAAATTASFAPAGEAPADGVYVLKVTVSDGALSASDEVQVTVDPQGTVVHLPTPSLLVVGSTPVTASDQALYNRLIFMLGSVNPPTVVTSAMVTVADANGKVLVFVAPSADAVALGEKLRNIGPPIVVANSSTFASMALTEGSGSSGSLGAQTELTITNPTHPLAASLPAGTRVVTTEADSFGWGTPAASAVTVARTVGEPAEPLHSTIFGYEAGSAMAGTPATLAPERRVGLFLVFPPISIAPAPRIGASGLKTCGARNACAWPRRRRWRH
jgi:hypothetical protein